MPPNRRSQGPAPPPIDSSSSRLSKRPKKPSARAQAQALAQVNQPGPSSTNTGEALSSRQKAAQLRRVLEQSQDRRATAADRVRAQRQRQEEEWKAEVAQFGEEEARHRLCEERESRRDMDQLTTSDVEEMELEDKVNNPSLDISGCLRVDKRLEWSTSLGIQPLDAFNIWSFERLLTEEIEKRDGYTKGWKLISHVVTIRAAHSRATRVIQSIDDLSDAEWEKAVRIITQQADKWKPELTIRIEVSAEVDKSLQRRPCEFPDLIEEPVSIDRLTRTDKLLDRARVKADVLKAAGNFDKELLEHWQCHDIQCRNKDGWCFVDYGGKHYDMDHTQQMMWSKAMANGELNVSVYRPPLKLYEFWIGNQGAVASTSRRTIQKQERDEAKNDREESTDFMQRFMSFNKQQLEMRLAESMADSVERMTSRQQSQQLFPPPPPSSAVYQSAPIWPQPQYNQPYHLPLPHPAMAFAPPLPAPPPPAPPLPATTLAPPPPAITLAPPSYPPPPSRNSSPIDLPQEEENVLDGFFEWKISRAIKPAWKEKIAEVQRIVDTHMWTIEHLKGMSDSTSSMYHTALQMGVPDGMARGFKEELKEFKAQWRQAKTLMTLCQ